jgi:hypothetical protein
VSVAVMQGARVGITCLDTSSFEASTVNSSPLLPSPRSSSADTNLDVQMEKNVRCSRQQEENGINAHQAEQRSSHLAECSLCHMRMLCSVTIFFSAAEDVLAMAVASTR